MSVAITRDRVRAVVQLHAAFGDSAPQLNEVFDTLIVHGLALEAVPGLSRQMLTDQLLFSGEQADRFLNADSLATRLAGRIEHSHVSVLARSDIYWPAQTQCPPAREMMPWLFVIGDPSLLRERVVGIGGSRHATDRSLEITRALSKELVTKDIVIASGGARGIDAVAHRAALEYCGRTVVVLAQGVGTFSLPSLWWSAVERGQLTVVSEFSPMAGWEGHQALQRNGTVIRLSEAFVVIQAEEMSGTLSAGRNALRLKRPLHVLSQTGEGADLFAGNEQLIEDGGVVLTVPADGSVDADMAQGLLVNDAPLIRATDQLRLF